MGAHITFEHHPPERGHRASAAAPAGGCCCCCCCLHTVGSAVGAAIASPAKEPELAIPPASTDAENLKPSNSAARLYWMMVLVGAIVAVVWFAFDEPNAGEAWLLLALVLPFVQLGASVVAAVVLLFSRRPNRGNRFRHLGKITAYSVAGALAGTLLMVLVGLTF